MSGHSRQAYYKGLKEKQQEGLKAELLIDQVLGYRKLQPRIGGRKLLHLLSPFMRHHSLEMGRDAFFRLLREYGLLSRRRRGKPRTTDSGHWLKKYPDLVKGQPEPEQPGCLWVSDITYLRLNEGDAFLSLVTDVYSRKIIGFYVSGSLGAEGCLLALQMAISAGKRTAGCIHHSDRGVQYCSKQYVTLLESNGINISMTQSGDPRDNAIAERVNGILKTELLNPMFSNKEEARAAVEKAVSIYNYLRPHSSLSMLTPALVHGSKPKVKRYWKNYYRKVPAKEVVMSG
nr:IS3 family transposase [Mucilaginibacter sp. L294]